jgi:protein gp37
LESSDRMLESLAWVLSAHCYAETLTRRFASAWGVPDLPWTPENAEQNVILHPERLDQPLRWKRPRMVFVNSMSDLFHELVPDEFIGAVFAAMALAPQHTFQILTKRHERMRDVIRGTSWEWSEGFARGFDQALIRGGGNSWPLPNVWLGTSIENRRYVGRADVLRQTPAAVRFISAEPLLGPLINVARETTLCECNSHPEVEGGHEICMDCGDDVPGCSCDLDLTDIDWLIVGGESGMGHRPMRADWVRDLRNYCQHTRHLYNPNTDQRGPGTAFFFKQWGGRTPKSGGRELDGRTWDEMPRVRPRVA